MADFELHLEHLKSMEDFWLNFHLGKYSFSTDNWPDDESEAISFEQGIKEFKDNHPDCDLFFEVDPDDGKAATIVMGLSKDHLGFWGIFNAFVEEFGPGDKLHAQQVLETIFVSVWFD
jgi:hypothetical protein